MSTVFRDVLGLTADLTLFGTLLANSGHLPVCLEYGEANAVNPADEHSQQECLSHRG